MTCGTLAGYRHHRTNGTNPCQPCERAYARLYGKDEPRADGKPVPAYNPASFVAYEEEAGRMRGQRIHWLIRTGQSICGTAAGYRKHIQDKERPCRPCTRAYREDREAERLRHLRKQ